MSSLAAAASSVAARVSARSAVRGASVRSARAHAVRAPRRAMAAKAEANILKDEDKSSLVDSVETFIFDCDGVIWKGDSLIEAGREGGRRRCMQEADPGLKAPRCSTPRVQHSTLKKDDGASSNVSLVFCL